MQDLLMTGCNGSTGTIIKGRYRMEELLGQGGFGQVYKARDTVLQVPVAVKRLFDSSPEMVEQFCNEARILARLKNRGLPRVTDYFRDAGGYFLVMDYIDGMNLEEKVLVRGAPLKVEDALTVMLQVMETLNYVHRQGVVHRDVKPGNIRVDRAGRAYLVDFGISKGKGTACTAPGARGAFSPYVSPPEQCTTGGTTTPASDIYSAGAVLYYCLTGMYPADAVSRLMGTPLGDWSAPVPVKVVEMVETAMALEPSERYNSAGEMARELTGTLSACNGPPEALPPAYPGGGPAPMFRRDIRRT